MKRKRPNGLPKTSGQTKIGITSDPPEIDVLNVSNCPTNTIPIPLLIAIALVIVTIAGGTYFLINAPSIEVICRQMGNCQKFKEDAAKAKESFDKVEKIFKSTKSLSELEAASKSLNETKAILSAIPDNANELVPPIVEQRNKAAELDKMIAVLLTVEQNADRAFKEAIAKIAKGDQIDRKPQGTTELPENAKSRLAKPKTLYVEAQVLLQSIPDKSFVAASKQEKLKQVIDKIKDLDGKIGAVAAIDTCVLKLSACAAAPVVSTPNPIPNSEPIPEPPVQWSEPRQADPPPPPSKKTLWGPGSSGY